jgi:hypothetical protein
MEVYEGISAHVSINWPVDTILDNRDFGRIGPPPQMKIWARGNQHPQMHQLVILSTQDRLNFSFGPWPCVNQHCTTVTFFWLLSFDFFFLLGRFFSNPDLHTTLPPSHPAELYLDLIYELTANTPFLPTHTTYLPCILSCTFWQNLELFLAKPLFGKTSIVLWLNLYFLIKNLYFSY